MADAEIEIAQCPLPPRMSLWSLMRALRTPNGIEQLVCKITEIAKKKGVDLTKPITGEDILGLANVFGLLAPMSEWVPGAGELVRRINQYICVPPGDQTVFKFCGSVRGANNSMLTKYKEFTVTPTNLTAQDSIRVEFSVIGSSIMKPWSELLLPSSCIQDGIFDTTENFWLPSQVSAQLVFENTDANSEACIRVEGKSWETI